MNCDEFLEALESTNSRQRAAARAHASDCSACAELADVHALLQRELNTSQPLPQRLRAVWSAASESPQVSLTRRAREGVPSQIPLALASLAAALMLLISVIFLTGPRTGAVADKPGLASPIAATSVTVVRSVDASAELDELLGRVNALEVELKAAASRAQLLDARREADVLLATYNNW